MGLVYDACNGGSGAGAKAQGWEPSHDAHPEIDIDKLVKSSDTIRDLFPEMEAACRVRDGQVEDEFERESLFGRLLECRLSPQASDRLAAVAYTGVLAGLFIGAFTLSIHAFSVDWDAPIDSALAPSHAFAAPRLPASTEATVEIATHPTIAQPADSPVPAPVAAHVPASGGVQGVAAGRIVSAQPRGDASLRLDGIIRWSGAKPIAIINGVTVEPGDVVEGYTVMAIDARGVMLLCGGEMYYLQIKQDRTLGV